MINNKFGLPSPPAATPPITAKPITAKPVHEKVIKPTISVRKDRITHPVRKCKKTKDKD
jgi:hypothetical protein